MDPLLKYADKNKNKFSCMVHLTDGYIPIPKIKTSLPVLIIITPDGAEPESIDMGNLPYKVIKMNRDV